MGAVRQNMSKNRTAKLQESKLPGDRRVFVLKLGQYIALSILHFGKQRVLAGGPSALYSTATWYCVTLVPDRTRKRKESQDGLGHEAQRILYKVELSVNWKRTLPTALPHH